MLVAGLYPNLVKVTPATKPGTCWGFHKSRHTVSGCMECIYASLTTTTQDSRLTLSFIYRQARPPR